MNIGDHVYYEPGDFSRYYIGIATIKVGHQATIVATMQWGRDNILLIYQIEFVDGFKWWISDKCVSPMGGPW